MYKKKTVSNIVVIFNDLIQLLTKNIILKNIPIKEYLNSVTGNINKKNNFIEPHSQIDLLKSFKGNLLCSFTMFWL